MTQSVDVDSASKPKSEVRAPLLYIATLFQSTGSSLLWPITTLYIHNVLHENMTIAGTSLMLMSLMMMLGSWLGGRLFDRWNPYRALVGSVTIALLSLISLIFWHGWPVFVIILCILGLADGAVYALLNSFAASIKSVDTRKVFNFQYLFMNVGVVIGTAVVGFLFEHGIQLIFIAASVMYIVFLVLTAANFKVASLQKKAAAPTVKQKKRFHWPVIGLALLGLTFAIYMAYVMWETVVATHMTSLGMSTEQYSFLWTLNGIVIIIGGFVLDRFIQRIPFKVSVLGGSTLFALSFIYLIFAHAYWEFILAFMILTFGEMFASPQIPAWVDHVGDPNNRGQSQGLITMLTSFGRAVGPLYGGLLIDHGSYMLLFASIFVIIMLFVIVTWILSQRKIVTN